MKTSWEKSVTSHDLLVIIVQKLRRLREDLERWSRDIVGNIFLWKKEISNNIEILDKQAEDN